MTALQPLDGQTCRTRILNMLKVFDGFCTENGLRYYLAYGSVLGAVRHQGFIPWDDDLDVSMPREDYDRLLKTWNQSAYPLLSRETIPGYPYYFAKITDGNTVVQSAYMQDVEAMGLFLDIFPMEPVNVTPEQAQNLRRKTSQVLRMLTLSGMKKFWPSGSPVRNCVKFAAYLYAKAWGSAHWMQKREQLLASYGQSGECPQYLIYSDIMSRKLFSPACMLQFEDGCFPCPGQTEQYLTELYGDFRILPPENQRVSNHDYTAYMRVQQEQK